MSFWKQEDIEIVEGAASKLEAGLNDDRYLGYQVSFLIDSLTVLVKRVGEVVPERKYAICGDQSAQLTKAVDEMIENIFDGMADDVKANAGRVILLVYGLIHYAGFEEEEIEEILEVLYNIEQACYDHRKRVGFLL